MQKPWHRGVDRSRGAGVEISRRLLVPKPWLHLVLWRLSETLYLEAECLAHSKHSDETFFPSLGSLHKSYENYCARRKNNYIFFSAPRKTVSRSLSEPKWGQCVGWLWVLIDLIWFYILRNGYITQKQNIGLISLLTLLLKSLDYYFILWNDKYKIK